MVALSRRLRLLLLALVLAWFFSPREIRDAIPIWVPFLVALGLEAHFLFSNYRSRDPFFEHDPGPQEADRERYGGGQETEWAIVPTEEGQVWVDLADEDEDEDDGAGEPPPAAAPPRKRRRLLRPLAETLAVLAVVGGLVLLLDREGWGDLSREEQAATEARISAEASRVVGRAVQVGCDTSGRHVGYVRHADGVAEVGGTQAFLTPGLCYALHRLHAHGDVVSFDRTARAVAVLAHEAWHLRGERNEGRTECFGLQTGVALGRRLGLEDGEARRMMRSQLVANALTGRSDSRYTLPAECRNRGELDLRAGDDRFP